MTVAKLPPLMSPREFRALWREFSAPSWRAWNSIEDAVFGIEPEDSALVRQLTGRTSLPSAPVAELIAIAGRGAGKSRFVGRLAVYFATARRYRLVPGEHVFIGVFSPTRAQSKVTFDYVRGLLRSVPALAALIVRETVDTVELSTGVIIQVTTGDQAAPRSRAYAVGIVEEAAFFLGENGDGDRELMRALRPALARVPGSLLCVVSSPYRQRGELYRLWREKYGVDDPDTLIVQGSTELLNPTFSRREIKRAYKEDPTSAAAEYGATFRTDVSDVFFGDALAECVDIGVRERLPERSVDGFAHFDGATGAGEDSAALTIARPQDGQGIQVLTRIWTPPFSPSAVVAEVAGLLDKHDIDIVQGDRFAPGLFADAFAARGISYRVSPADTSQSFLELLTLVNSGAVRLLDNDIVLAQLRALERRTRAGGRDQVGHGPHGHDDAAASVAGALIMAAREAMTEPFDVIGSGSWLQRQAHREGAGDADQIDDAVATENDEEEDSVPPLPTGRFALGWSALTSAAQRAASALREVQQERTTAASRETRVRARQRDERAREAHRREVVAHEREQAEMERRRAEASAAFVRRRIERTGWYVPPDGGRFR